MPRLNYIEIRDAFPEGKQIVNRLIKRKKIVLDTYAMEIREIMKDPYLTEFEKIFNCQIVEQIHLPKILAEYNRLKKYAFFYQAKRSNEYNLKVENARNVPIESLIEGKIRRIGAKRIQTCCPFHSEKQPSFMIYKDTNSFFCFSCNKGGDVIHFIRLLYDLDFKDAIRYLNDMS